MNALVPATNLAFSKPYIMKKMLLVPLMMVIISCNTSRITSSWKAPDAEARSYNKILVLALLNEPDRTIREKMEEQLAGDLKNLGYKAICSCDEFGPKVFEDMNEKQALDKLENSGIDAVLTVVLLDKTKERYYVPGRIYYSPYVIYHNRFWGYYRTMRDRVYVPGYYSVNTRYFWESNFYSLDGKELLYSAQSQSFEPESISGLSHEYGEMIVKDMVSKHILTNSNAKDSR